MNPRLGDGTTPAVAAQRRPVLEEACAEIGVDLDPATVDRLLAYLALLQQWNRVYNLTALRDPDEMLSHHLIDCLAVLPSLVRYAEGRGRRILDVGSGGGLPGVVLAITQPSWQVTCVDTVSKKASFIRQVAAELGLANLRSVHARVEAMPSGQGPYDMITSRAFASLSDFTGLTRDLLADGGVWAAMKGKLPVEEQAQLPADLDVFHVEQLAVPGLDAQRCLVWMRPRAR